MMKMNEESATTYYVEIPISYSAHSFFEMTRDESRAKAQKYY